jgi:hypothetical protein
LVAAADLPGAARDAAGPEGVVLPGATGHAAGPEGVLLPATDAHDEIPAAATAGARVAAAAIAAGLAMPPTAPLPAGVGDLAQGASLQQEFAMKDLGVLHHFLGVTVEPRLTVFFTSGRILLISWSELG